MPMTPTIGTPYIKGAKVEAGDCRNRTNPKGYGGKIQTKIPLPKKKWPPPAIL